MRRPKVSNPFLIAWEKQAAKKEHAERKKRGNLQEEEKRNVAIPKTQSK